MKSELWKNYANCRGEDPRRFLDGFEDARLSEKMNTVKLCIDCPAFDACKLYAEEHKAWGIHAGKFYQAGKPKNPFKVRKPKFLTEQPVSA